MYQLGGLLKFLAIMVPFYLVFSNHFSYWYLFLIAPLWLLIFMFDSLKRGAVFFNKIEWEKGPFDFESLPLPARKFFSEGNTFLTTVGFSSMEEGLSTSGTFQFGREEIKSVIKLYENSSTGEWATQSFAFTWNPGSGRCRFIGAAWRFVSLVQDETRVTANSKFFLPEADGERFRIQYINELNSSELLRRHREWVKEPGDHSALVKLFGSFSTYVQKTIETEMVCLLKTGYFFVDPKFNAYRYTIKGARWIFGEYFRIHKKWKSTVEGLKPFTWKIRLHPEGELLRSTTLSGTEGNDDPEQRVVAFKVGFLSVFRNRLYSFTTGPWLTFFGLLLLLIGIGSFYQLIYDFSLINLLYYSAGLFMDFYLMILFASLIALILPMGGQRYTARFGKRLLKFYGEVICYESPHGVTTCVLGSFPEARSVRKGFWVKIPGVESFVLKPSQFEGDGYKVFKEEMERKKLVRPFLLGTLMPWFFILALLILGSGLTVVEYQKCSYNKTVQGVFNKDRVVLSVNQLTYYMKALRLERWWTPLIYFSNIIPGDEMMHQRKLNVRIWRVAPDGFENFTVSCLGTNVLHLIPVGSEVYLVTEDYKKGPDYGMVYFIYRIEKDKGVMVLGAEAKNLMPKVTTRDLVFTEGWKPLTGSTQEDNLQKTFNVALPDGYEYFNLLNVEKGGDKIANTFGLRKNNAVVVSDMNSFDELSGKGIPVTKEEFEKNLNGI